MITIANRRGGAGKTTAARNLAAGLTARGSRVLLVDLDSQKNLTIETAGAYTGPAALGVLAGTVDAAAAVIETAPGVYLLPAREDLAGADRLIKDPDALKKALRRVAGFDYVIIDTPPALGMCTICALTASDAVIIPIKPEIHSIQGAALLLDAVQAVKKKNNKKLRAAGLLLMDYNARRVLARDMKEAAEKLAAANNTRVFATLIRGGVAVPESQAARRPVIEYAKSSNAARDFETFINEFLQTEGAKDEKQRL